MLARLEVPDDTMLLCGKRAHEGVSGGGIGELLRPLSGGGGAGIYSLDFGPALSCLD